MKEITAGEEFKLDAKQICVSLSWEVSEKEAPECDLLAMVLNEKGTVSRRYDLVFYNMPAHRCGGLSILPESSGNTEKQFFCDLDMIGADYAGIDILLNIYEADRRKQSLDMVRHLNMLISDAASGDCICEYHFSAATQGKTAAVVGHLKKRGGEWYFLGGEQTFEIWMPAELLACYGLCKWKE